METGIIFREQNQNLFKNYWDKYIADNKISPYYLFTNIEYLHAYAAGRIVKDRSFVYIKNNKPVSCVFLPIEAKDGLKSITIAGSFSPAPLFLSQRDLEQKMMNQIDIIAEEEKVKKIMFRVDPLESASYSYNFLMDYDYLDASLVGYLVDCKNISMRRNHQRAVRKINSDNDFSIFIMTKDNKDYQIHEKYRELHHKCSGRITRSKETFDLLFKLLEQGNAILVGLNYKGKFIAFTYFSHNGSKAISYSAADDPDFDHLPLYHIINFNAINYFHRIGIEEIDMGQPFNISNQFFYFPDQKQKNISLFKSGFGGRFVSNFFGVKYFSKDVFEADLDNFKANYIKNFKLK